MEPSSGCTTIVKRLPRDACFDVLSLGDFSLHEQREVTRSPDASGNAQDASTILRAGWLRGRFALQVTRSPDPSGNVNELIHNWERGS
jgi:hypothetical protein